MIDQLDRYETYAYYTGSQITPTTGDNLMSFTDRKGQVTTFNQYDPMNRLAKVTYNDGSNVQFTYDSVGRTTNINDSLSGAITYTYNDFNCTNCSGRGLDRISQETTPLSSISYTYDKVYRRLSMTVAGQSAVNYTFDAAGRLTKIGAKVGTKIRTYNLVYDNADRRTSLQIPISTTNKYVTTTYGYDNANHPTSLLLKGPSATIESLTYSYDPNGNRTSFTRTATQTLPSAMSGATYNDANEMIGYNNKNIVYDANGNLSTKTDVSGTTTYTWDARNRLMGLSGPSLSASFSYDALGRRISKTINGTTTQYVYDGWDIVQEIKGGVQTNYVRTLNLDEPLTRTNSTTTRHYVADALGSVIALADDTGAKKTTYVYDAFANTSATGETSDNPFQYTARENDGTGLYYYRARYYSPEMQRFISEDPIRLRGGINYHIYVQNNPVRWRDPKGLEIPGLGPEVADKVGRDYDYIYNKIVPKDSWSLTIEAYDGLGGGFVVGRNPDGQPFLSFRVGYGLGGAFAFDPKGKSPGYDECKKHGWALNIGAGIFGTAGVAAGPLALAYNAAAGVNVEKPGGVYGYFDHGWANIFDISEMARVRGELAGGIEITFH